MEESKSIELAIGILERKGFKHIKFLRKPYDIEAEKNGLKKLQRKPESPTSAN